MQTDLQASAWPYVAGIFGFLIVLILCAQYPLPATALIAGVAVARIWRWPRIPLRYYATTRKVTLPALLLLAGIGAQYALAPGAGMLIITAGSIVVVASGGAVVAIFRREFMQKIFDLVPADQRGELDAFLGAGSPQGKFADFSSLDQQAVIEEIKQRVIGQDNIVESVVSTAFRRARMPRPNKPIAVFLLVGATGAGKTELAKALAGSLYGDANKLIRVDCNELTDASSVSRLVGSPPGYLGSTEGSAFCREIGRVGTGVILLDEVEKADPAVMRVLMGLMDEARITEQSTSQTYSATGFLIVLTSNAASREIAQVVDAGSEDRSEQVASVKDALKQTGFLPEVLARIDAVFPFGALSRSAVAEVVGLFLKRFATDAGIELASVDAGLLIDLVQRQEKMQDYGIREVVRMVESAVTDGLLDARDAGFAHAAIRVHGDVVTVEGMR